MDFIGHQICCGIAVFSDHFLGKSLIHEETHIHCHMPAVTASLLSVGTRRHALTTEKNSKNCNSKWLLENVDI